MYAMDPLEHMPEQVRTYWLTKEQELQERLLRVSYAIAVFPNQTPVTEKSGILFLMTRHLWFEDFPKSSFFFFTRQPDYKKMILQFSRQTLSEVAVLRQSQLDTESSKTSGFWKFFHYLGTDPLYLRLTTLSKTGEACEYLFRDLNDPETWLSSLHHWQNQDTL